MIENRYAQNEHRTYLPYPLTRKQGVKRPLLLAVFVAFSVLMAFPAQAIEINEVPSWKITKILTEEPFNLWLNESSIQINMAEKSLTIDGRFYVPLNGSVPEGDKYLGFSFDALLSDGDIWYRNYGSQDSFVHLNENDFSYLDSLHGYNDIYYTMFPTIPAGTDKEFRLKFYFAERPKSFITYFGTGSTTIQVTEGTNIEINNSYYSMIIDKDGCGVVDFWDITTNRNWVFNHNEHTHAKITCNDSAALFGTGTSQSSHTATIIEESDVHVKLKCGSGSDWVYIDCYTDFPYCFFNYSITEVCYAVNYFPVNEQDAYMLGANYTEMEDDSGAGVYNQVDVGFASTNLSTVNRSLTWLFDKGSDGVQDLRVDDNADSPGDSIYLGLETGAKKTLNLWFNWWYGLAAYSNGNKESMNDSIMYIESTMDVTDTAGSCEEQTNGTIIFDCTTDSDNVLTTRIHQNNTNITNAYFKVRFNNALTNGQFYIYNNTIRNPTAEDFYVAVNESGTFNEDGVDISDTDAGNYTDVYNYSVSNDSGIMMMSFNSDIYLSVRTTKLPKLVFISPTLSNNSYTANNYMEINVSSLENATNVLLEWNDGSIINKTMGVTNASDNTILWINMTLLSDREYTFRVYATLHTTGISSTGFRNITVDTTKPMIFNISFLDEMTNEGINFSANKNGTLVSYCSDRTLEQSVTGTLPNYAINCSGGIGNLKYIKFILYDPKGDHYRTLIPTFNIGNLTFYMINTTPDDVTVNLVTYLVTDASLLYQTGIMHFKKTILEEGQKDIIDTIIGSDGKVYAYLIGGEVYTISVESADGISSKTLGEYTTPDATTTSQPLTIIDVTFIPTEYNYIGTDISWAFDMDTDAGRIYFRWNDTTGQTNNIQFWIYNITNVTARNLMYYDSVSGQSNHLFQWVYGSENDTYLGYFEVDHAIHGNITESRPIAKGGIFYSWLGNIGAWYHIISIFIIIFVASIFGAKSAPIGAVILAIIAGFLFYIEWLPSIIAGGVRLTDLLMISLIALAILAMFIIKRRRA